MRNDSLIRALKMVAYLRGGRRSLAELAAEFHVSTRTIRRDLEALSLAGVAVRSRVDGCGGFPNYWWVVGE